MIANQPDILGALQRAEAYLVERGVPNARRNAEWMLAHVLSCRSPELYLDPHRLLDKAHVDGYDGLVHRRGEREPLQYILGSTEFMSLTFETVPGVFIPRPDTEVLIECVEKLVRREDQTTGRALLDLCSGTGIIAVSLLYRNRGISGVAVDIDPAAAALTRKNAGRNGVLDRLDCLTENAVAYLGKSSRRFDIIVCNPPYVETGEMDRLPPEIRQYEPTSSLDGGPDGLDFYRNVIPLLEKSLKARGITAFEIGDTQGTAVAGMLAEAGLGDVGVHQDYNGVDRVVTALNP